MQVEEELAALEAQANANMAALLEEEESGTLDRILVSRAGLFHVVAGKWLGILLLGCLQITVMFVWAEAVFRIQLGNHLPGFLIMTFCTAGTGPMPISLGSTAAWP